MRVLAIISLFINLISCSEQEKEPVKIDWNKEKSTEMNKELAIQNEIEIKLFLEQHPSWKMTKTGSGLQFFIYEEGSGEKAQVGQSAQVETEVTLLDGTECYKTKDDEYEE